MSARWTRNPAEGAAGGARTTQTYILGIGASGALLAGAGVALISLVGLVSFDVWPGTPPGARPAEEAQLNFGAATRNQPQGGTPLSEAAGLLAAASPEGTVGDPSPGGGDAPAKKPAPGGDQQEPPPAAPSPTIPVEPPVVEPDSRDGSQDSGGTGKRDPVKGVPKGKRPRTEPPDDPDEFEPGEIPDKSLRGRHGSGKSRGSNGDNSSGSDQTRRGGSSGSSYGAPRGSSSRGSRSSVSRG